jgi:uncharacterized membrane protein YkoI
MRRRILVVALLAAIAALAAATFALGGPRGLIWDDGQFAKPGAIDDGKELQSKASVSLASAVATAQDAARGALGQVDLERYGGGIVYMVDLGSQEVRVDATTGQVVSIKPRD